MFKILLLLVMITSVTEVPNPRNNNEWVSDTIDLIPAEVEARMNATLSRLNQELGVEIAVVAVDDVSSTPKEFATSLFNHWGIGNASADNGLLILMVRDKRRLEMETGYGLEAILPDSWLGTMQLTDMVPSFKRGDFGDGLEAGLSAIDERLRRNASGLPPSDSTPRAFTSNNGPRHASKLWTFLLLGLAAIALGVIVTLVKRHNRTCHACKLPMNLLDDQAEDQHLSREQLFEERLRSVLYDVYHCARCESIKIFDNDKWFSGYSRCSSCNVKAMTSSSTTLTSATYDSGGLVQISQHCQHCSYHNTYTQSTPRLTRSTSSSSSSSSSSYSSSSSGSSSFGGGSSGGGGAGSSW